ncbi:MAG: DUF2584 domain-containing protein [Oculatellaceae cyanobacterium Prado106]|nr:DUF2584 domain-containing protein [Oculatellaceae cyanobacterium Prado106]
MKLSAADYPERLDLGVTYQVVKPEYRIFPLDVPIALVNSDWVAHADVIIRQLTWVDRQTQLIFEISRIYPAPFPLK